MPQHYTMHAPLSRKSSLPRHLTHPSALRGAKKGRVARFTLCRCGTAYKIKIGKEKKKTEREAQETGDSLVVVFFSFLPFTLGLLPHFFLFLLLPFWLFLESVLTLAASLKKKKVCQRPHAHRLGLREGWRGRMCSRRSAGVRCACAGLSAGLLT